VPLFANLARVAEARAMRVGRHLGLRAGLLAGCAFVATLALFFVLVAATIALSERYGAINACIIMAGGALVVLGILLIALAIERRKYRRRRLLQNNVERQNLIQAATLAAMPRRLPSRNVTGLILVAAGALLVFMRGRAPDDD
jgi:hypothetical protein